MICHALMSIVSQIIYVSIVILLINILMIRCRARSGIAVCVRTDKQPEKQRQDMALDWKVSDVMKYRTHTIDTLVLICQATMGVDWVARILSQCSVIVKHSLSPCSLFLSTRFLDVDSNRDRDQEEELVNRALDLRAEGGSIGSGTGTGTGTGTGIVGGDTIEVSACSWFIFNMIYVFWFALRVCVCLYVCMDIHVCV